MFASREWKEWSECRRPAHETWDDRRQFAAKLQRKVASVFRIHCAYLRLKNGKASPVGYADAADVVTVEDLEREARTMMARLDVRATR